MTTDPSSDRPKSSRIGTEATAPGFSLTQLLEVRARTRQAVWAIADHIRPGMTEEEGRRAASETLAAMGLRRGWHRVVVRFGANTALPYSKPSRPGVVLGEPDLFFVDIGPVLDGYEGDAGDTFLVGDDPNLARAVRDVKGLWKAVRDRWRRDGTSGEALYHFAADRAMARSWELDLELTGHRLSEFPHKAHFTGTLADVAFPPSPGAWVLEIQIRHPEEPFGAFFEDLLLDDEGLQRLAFEPPAR